ncbi:hypothetical protein B0T19DRAFT_366827 [Cercophora scortea]|uniref:NACHT domain-containing protein n=1 Tax=Cercophora scortea TaxID=314031 RepID=A0AAE0IW73_9PEZI|nr:hypothetical protein B0T19DRAFT_366827 [Cercophora scortea]
MAEALALGASAVAFIQLADRVIGLCKFYIESVRDVPHDIRVILIEVSSLKSILDNLRFLATADANAGAASSSTIRNLGGPDGTLGACGLALGELEKLFPEDHIQQLAVKKKRKRLHVSQIVTALAWPLKASKAKKLLDEISQHKSTITIALSVETRYARRQSIHQWLEVTNPSELHNKSCSLRQQDTGFWMLTSQKWQDWLAGAGQSRLLWIHGIPGAGKTVLASTLIENIPKHQSTSQSLASGTAYYYCYFGHQQDETAPFLKWVISQLCRQAGAIPSSLVSMFQSGLQPSVSQLVGSLAETVAMFSVVYVVIDAVDESTTPRNSLLDLLVTIATDERFKNVRLLATSREYHDIQLALSHCSVSAEMESEKVQEDIRFFVRSYIQTDLQRDRRFSSWPAELITEIEGAVSQGARGMFRWAVCQMDILRRLATAGAVRAALQDLPETLDETYERIFAAISAQERPVVQRALALLCGHPDKGEISAHIFLQLLFETWNGDTNNLGVGLPPLWNAENLKDTCGCLVTISREHTKTISLAHFTVKEFLYSPRIWNNFSKDTYFFRLTDEIAAITSLITILSGVFNLSPAPGMTSELNMKTISDHCLFFGFWGLLKWEGSLEKGGLQHLGFRLFDPLQQHYKTLERRILQSISVNDQYMGSTL